MTQKLKSFTIGLLLMGVLGHPALADMGNRDHGLSQEELAFIFGDPNADGFEILSPQEMEEIEGRWTFLALRQAFYSGALQVWMAARSFRPVVRYDRKPHEISSRWGPLQGNRPHVHIGYYIKGVKGSKRDIAIIPMGPRTTPHTNPNKKP